MGMSKRDFVALADAIKEHNRIEQGIAGLHGFSMRELDCLARFCAWSNPNFLRDRWLDYIAGKCGPNGGNVKQDTGWDIQGNYGQGWETVCSEDKRADALERLREYRENESQYSHRIVRAKS